MIWKSASAIFHHETQFYGNTLAHTLLFCLSLLVTKAEELNKQTNHVTTY